MREGESLVIKEPSPPEIQHEIEIQDNEYPENIVLERTNVVITFDWGFTEAILLFFCVVLGIFVRLWLLQQPRFPYPGEIDFIQSLANLNRQYFTIPKYPPLSLLVHSWTANHSLYHDEYADVISTPGYKYSTMAYVSLRQASAFLSSLTVPLAFLTLRSFNVRNFASFIPALVIAFDPYLISQGRTVDRYGFTSFCVSVSLFCLSLLHHFRYNSDAWLMTAIAQMAFVGMSAASNNICFGLLALSVFYYTIRFRSLFAPLLAVIICALVYFLSYFSYVCRLLNGGEKITSDESLLGDMFSWCLRAGNRGECSAMSMTAELIKYSVIQALSINQTFLFSLEASKLAEEGERTVSLIPNKVCIIVAFLFCVISILTTRWRRVYFAPDITMSFATFLLLASAIALPSEGWISIPLYSAYLVIGSAADRLINDSARGFILTLISFYSVGFLLQNHSEVFGYRKQ